MKRKLNVMFIVLLLGSALIPLTGTIFNVSTPNYNPTPLPTFPNVIEDKKLNHLFFDQFDDYFTLQFPFRTLMISAYNKFNEVVFNESKNEKVIIGEEGYYFFEETMDDYFKVNTLSKHELSRLNQVLAIQKEYLDSKGIDSYFVAVPNKATIYPEYMPSQWRPKGETSNLDQLSSMSLSMPYINLKESLLDGMRTSDVSLYHKQDSHWNNVGAGIAYSSMLEKIQREPLDLLNQHYSKKEDWQSDLARMLYPSTKTFETQYYYQLPNQFTFTRAIRSFEDVDIESLNPTQEGSLFVFRDSFANALIPYFSESFERVHYSRAFPYDYNKVEQFNPEVLIIEIAERNMNWLIQKTPRIISSPKKRTIVESSMIDLEFVLNESEKDEAYFYNALFSNQEAANSITEIKIIYEGYEYDAFPIYEDDDVEDEVIEIGFSMYTLKQLQYDKMNVFVKVDGLWSIIE